MMKHCSGGASGDSGPVASLFVLLLGAFLLLAGPADATRLNSVFNISCMSAQHRLEAHIGCGWGFDSIARLETEKASGRAEDSTSSGKLDRIGFATSDLTTEQTAARLSERADASLSWDRQLGIARELSIAMEVSVDPRSLTSQRFLLMPAAFNTAYLSDFVDFIACTTSHTFIFAGALDGRSDAPHVTERSKESKENICLDMEGAGCSGAEPKFRSARRYFHGNWPCRYRTKFPYSGTATRPVRY